MKDIKLTARMISMRNVFIVVYILLAGVLFTLTCAHFITSNSMSLLAQSENYTLSAAKQAQRTVENYCSNIERAQYVIFENQKISSFYPMSSNPTGEELRVINRITERLSKTAYLGDYADIGIVYRNGLSAGLVSDGVRDLMGANVFQRGMSLLGDSDSCWTVLYYQNVSRACFFKRINDNAVMISSFYVTNLGNIFTKNTEDSNFRMYITDPDDRIIYASENVKQSTGDRMPYDVIERFGGQKNVTVGDKRGAASLVELKNGWRLYSVVTPKKTGRFGMGSTESFILIVGLSTFMLTIALGFIITAFYTAERKTRRLVEDRVDKDTGLLTPFYFEEEVSDQIETALPGGTWAYTKAVIKDQKVISERLGEDFIAGGVIKLSELLKEHFGSRAVIGITEEREITLFTDFSDFDIFKAHEDLKLKHEECIRIFKKLLVGDDGDYKLNVAVGVCIYPDNGRDFDELDYKVSIALEEALKKESDSLVFYDEKQRTGAEK